MPQINLDRYEIEQSGSDLILRDTVEGTSVTINKGNLGDAEIGTNQLEDSAVSPRKAQPGAGAEVHPIRNVVGEDTWFTTKWQLLNGSLAPITAMPDSNATEFVCVQDPQDKYRMLTIGGTSETSDTKVYAFDIVKNEWLDGDTYPDLSSTSILSNNGYSSPVAFAATTVGNYIVAAGGGGDNVFYLDTSQSSPSWQVLSDTLPSVAERGGMFSYNGNAYYFGGSDDSSNTLSNFSKIDVTASSGSQVDSSAVSDAPVGVSYIRHEMPMIDDELFVCGRSAEAPTSGVTQTQRFWKYNFTDDAWTELSPNKELLFGGGNVGEGTDAFGNGQAFAFNGYIYYLGGFHFHSKRNVAIYDPKSDTWVGRESAPASDEKPVYTRWSDGITQGAKSGILVDDVFWLAGTFENRGNAGAYVPERNPPEFN